jgi:hypothetical protein
VFSFKKKFIQLKDVSGNSESAELALMKDQLFFHDLINHTHGLLLFFEQKEMRGSIVREDEVQMIKKEIKTLQSLIRDHYDFKHKNLVQTYDWVPFSYAKLAFDNLSQTYLENVAVTTTFVIDKDTDENLIYYPCYYRILNNLIKNISESKCNQVHFTFTINEKGLQVETKNHMQKSGNQNSSEYLTQVILDEKVSPIRSMGLDSIHHLAEENGGHFSFEISQNTWVNKLFLPTQKIKSDKIPA